ncbi:MAG: ATP-binding protein [Deltaproteobacteria bacterium]|nr:ATP-binding protein [Deltaproteobacteria bacterium]
MDERFFTVATYAVLALLWGSLVVIYLRHYMSSTRRDPLVASLLAVLALDALKNLVESVYFGTLWGSRYEVLPRSWGEPLESPFMMPLPKLFNIVVAVVLLLRVAGRFIPDELRSREARRDEEERLRAMRQETLARVQESERRLQSLFEATTDLVSTWVPSGGAGRFVLESLNPAARAFFHVREGEKVADVDDATALFGHGFAALLQQATSSRKPVRRDSELTNTPSGPRQLNTQVIPFVDDNGVVVRVASLSHDITEITTRAEEEDQRTRLESLGLLAGGVAHDFNNLLAVVKADVDLARTRTRGAGENDTGSEEVLAHAGDAIARARELVEQLMATAGARARQSEPVDVVAVVADTVRLLAPAAGHVRLRIEGRPDDAFVHGDRAQLQQIVLNLLQNGVEVLGGNGTVTARVGVAGDDVVITVSDDGPGISPAVQARMFDPFFTTKTDGRGLGLSTVFGLARAHGGSVEVHSGPVTAPGQLPSAPGATFSVHLPRCSAPQPIVAAMKSPPTTPPPPAWPTSLRVLLVDDDDRVRRATRRLLERLGHTVQDVASGLAALEVDDDYDLVVLDVTMPDLDGPATLLRLRGRRPQLPAVIITGRGGFVVKDDVVLAKPFDPDHLQAAIEAALERQRLQTN